MQANKIMEIKKEASAKETSLSPTIADKHEIVNFDPQADVERARVAAKALMGIIEQKPKKVVMNGETYLEFEDWQTIGQFFQHTVGTDWTKPIEEAGKIIGYEAKSILYNRDGLIIGGAEAACMRDEPNWKAKPLFQLRSMAQTRAMAKALRSRFGFVAVLAGFKPTPAEEMTGTENAYNENDDISPKQKDFIKALMDQRGIAKLTDIGIEQPKRMTKDWASDIITELQAYKPKSAIEQEAVLSDKQLDEVGK